jgi:UDP-N-acetylglucosamine--N-acetylmuramyl-(pentapeptide) pyrophosphoryl-undecaprenol N-acetylglucosamine transferase
MPALALAEALRAVQPDVEPVIVGAQRGIDATLLPSRPYRYHLLPVEPIHRRAWWKNARWPLILARLLRAGARVLREEQPILAVGTGGYAAGPILWQASRRGIPMAIQEQNAYPGVTTRWLARRAAQVHLGFPEARIHLRPGGGTEVCQFGNPIVPPPTPRLDRGQAKQRLGIGPTATVVLVMGGSQGALGINRAVEGAIQAGLFDEAALVWSTGVGQWDALRRYDDPPRRQVRPFLDPIGDVYAAADLVVGRSGAMTTAELCAWGLPSVLIPLPTAAAGHQARNAGALARAGAAVHLPESALTPESLAREVKGLLADPDRLARMREAAAARGQPTAARDIARHLLGLARGGRTLS